MPDKITKDGPAYRELMAEFAGYQRGVEHGRATNVGTTIQAARMWAFETLNIDPTDCDTDPDLAEALAYWVMTGESESYLRLLTVTGPQATR